MTNCFAIVEINYGIDGKETDFTVKAIFDYLCDAEKAVFDPYVVKEIEIDCVQIVKDLGRGLTVKERYALDQFNEMGLKEYLGL